MRASNARFLLRADPSARFRAAVSTMNLVDPSAMLIKPMLPGETFDGDFFGSSQNGGARWGGKTGSAEYQTTLEWMRGRGGGVGRALQ